MAIMDIQLGQWLVEEQVIEPEQLEVALAKHEAGGARLGDVLVAEGTVSYLTLYRAMAGYFGLPFVNLLEEKPEATLSDVHDLNQYIALRALPWQRDEGGVLIATSEPSLELEDFATERFGDQWQLVITSPLDIRLSIEQLFAEQLGHVSVDQLYDIAPDQSAKKTTTTAQQISLVVLAVGAIAAAIWSPAGSLAGLLVGFHVLFGLTLLLKHWLFMVGSHSAPQVMHREEIATDRLPVYTILVPLYKEAAVLPRLLGGLLNLNYPTSKLDIKLVCEADDTETIEAAKALHPPSHVDIIAVPPVGPRTKPKACNYALQFARGDIVTIYDAEDIPDPDQLKKVVSAFEYAPYDTVCLQAELRYYNANENWLSRWFDIEYGILFGFLHRGLAKLGIPLPLGGTSNHIHMARLKEFGAWDPYNVTEDADLGYRMAIRGYRTLPLDSVTLEESTLSLGPWMRQRTRWIKGFMQTWLVHMRSPIQLYRSLGFTGFWGFQFFIGVGWLVFLTGPLVWIASLVVIAGDPTLASLIPSWFVELTTVNLILHFVLHWHQAWMLHRRDEQRVEAGDTSNRRVVTQTKKQASPVRKFLSMLTFPLYYVLHSIASYLALFELITRPHYWAKTEHGVTQIEYDAGDG